MPTDNKLVIKELEGLLQGGNAHAPFEEAVKDVPLALLGSAPHGLPYNIWQLVEHIRIVQWDILEFSGAKSPGAKPDDSPGDLLTPFPHGDGQTLLREALLIADHTSYHTGEIILLRRLLGDWK